MGRTTPEFGSVHLAARSSRSDTSMRRGASGHRPTNQTKQRKAILLQVIEFKVCPGKWARQRDARRTAARRTTCRMRRLVKCHDTLRGALNSSAMGMRRGAHCRSPHFNFRSPLYCRYHHESDSNTLPKRGQMECDASRAPPDRRGNEFKPLLPTDRRRRRPATRSRAGAGASNSARRTANVWGV
jgi:hypothetical protein